MQGKKKIVLSGAGGLVAGALSEALLRRNDYELYLITSKKDRLEELYRRRQNVFVYTVNEFTEVQWPFSFDVIVHAAFSRSADGKYLAESLALTGKLLQFSKKNGLSSFVYISSQGVYGTELSSPWKEADAVRPSDMYAVSKYAGEEMISSCLEETIINYTSLRLASVCSNDRFIKFFAESAIEGKTIVVTSPQQQCSFIDLRDAVSGLCSVIENADRITFSKVYNFGADLQNTVLDIAYRVKLIGEKYFQVKNATVEIKDSGIHRGTGMNSSLFRKTFNWKSQYNMDDMIYSIYESLLKHRKKD